jgi:hypothetical protein
MSFRKTGIHFPGHALSLGERHAGLRLVDFWLSTIVTTTLSGVALKCFTTASVMSRISAFFCSGVRPSTAWT